MSVLTVRNFARLLDLSELDDAREPPRLTQLAQFLDHFRFRRKPSLFPLGEQLLVVGGDDEDAAAAANELAVEAQFLLDLSRQTGGSGKVVSNAAVVDSNVHSRVLSKPF